MVSFVQNSSQGMFVLNFKWSNYWDTFLGSHKTIRALAKISTNTDFDDILSHNKFQFETKEFRPEFRENPRT